MRTWFGRIALVSIVATAATPSRGEEPGVAVRVESGLLRGFAGEGVVRFLGVPYAAPPVGALRWAPPQPVARWEGGRDASRPGNAAPQAAGGDLAKGAVDEDCLFLNVTAPAGPSTRGPRPVMVWLHGGGFSAGSANAYDPRRMVVAGDVVVVSVEFRLNVFGFFGFPGLEGSGTFGLLDQRAALRWVARNVAAFGGDPKNVTLFGESGGAIAASAQVTSPGARGLFHKAILQSGAATTSFPRNAAGLGPHGSFWRPIAEVEEAGADLAAKLGCPAPRGSAEALRWLREQPAESLLAHASAFGTAAYGGAVLPEHPAAALRAGRFEAMPTMSGYTRDEGLGLALGRLLMAGGKAMADDERRGLFREAFGERAPEVEAQYPADRLGSPAQAWAAAYTDRMFAAPQVEATRAMARRAPAFAFEFADPDAPGLFPFFPGFPRGALHSGELPFLFDVEGKPIDMTGQSVPLTEAQQALARTMIAYWTNFARAGDPNADGLPAWPRFDAEGPKPSIQVLAPGPDGVRPSVDAAVEHRCDFWGTFPE